jgi:hypothetical protein
MTDYDWENSTDDLVFPAMAAVAVYLNADGDLVIRQQRDQYEDEDSVVIIPRDRVPALIRKISGAAELRQGHPRLVKD